MGRCEWSRRDVPQILILGRVDIIRLTWIDRSKRLSNISREWSRRHKINVGRRGHPLNISKSKNLLEYQWGLKFVQCFIILMCVNMSERDISRILVSVKI